MFAGAGNAGVAARSRIVDRSDDPTPEHDARIVGEMSAIFFRTFRSGGGAGDADLPGAGFTPDQINRFGARALADARRRFAAKG